MPEAFRIEIRNTKKDSRGFSYLKKVRDMGYGLGIEGIETSDQYTVLKNLDETQQKKSAQMLHNPVFESFTIDQPNAPSSFDWVLLIGFLPGVTDNVGSTVRESIEDLLKVSFDFPAENVYSAEVLYITGDLTPQDQKKIGDLLANKLIQRIEWKSAEQFRADLGMNLTISKVDLHESPQAQEVDLDISDEDLIAIGKKGIKNADGSFRGPLALNLNQMQVIRDHFKKIGRKPFDIELESIAQTWSEHCKHTIFACPIDEIKDGLYKGLIKRATNEIRATKGKDDFCISVFSDNAGGIIFDEKWSVTDKAETHNSPSALDPFGGAITGIVGVNRDSLGYGKGSKPIINRYGFCTGNPAKTYDLYRQKGKVNPILQPRTILDGVVAGVRAGGNESGIPCPQGFVYFDDRYSGKPLVFAGTVGLIPRIINGTDSSKKKALPGDKIVVAGGRVGLDGIHGATFSSEALDSGSPATAVQIGDPITQKKMSDTIVREARHLYNNITDNGAGGISCSIPEMATSSDCGCRVELDKVPLKYPNLSPWQIWISESQERMTFAVPPENVDQLIKLFKKRGVEAVVVGEFVEGDQCEVNYHGNRIMDISLAFLHDGWPRYVIKTQKSETLSSSGSTRGSSDQPHLGSLVKLENDNMTDLLHRMLRRPNITSYEFISKQYDHNVQASSVIQPLQGKGRVNGSATVSKPIFDSPKGVVTSQGINARYSDWNTYHMSACSIDDAIAAAVAVGGNVDHMAIMDNFCWCSSDEPERLWELKRSVQACYDTAVAFGTPFISGKDSMYNDFKGFDADDNPVKVSVPPTLLVSAISVIPQAIKALTMDAKESGDLIYVIGDTRSDEILGSEYLDELENLGTKELKNEFSSPQVLKSSCCRIPQVNAKEALDRYKRMFQASQESLLASCIHVDKGGLGVALAKMAIAGQMGVSIELNSRVNPAAPIEGYLFSESKSRFVVSIDPSRKEAFESLFADARLIGKVADQYSIFNIQYSGQELISASIQDLTKSYHSTFQDF
ncbi:MAG TPA: AIR synthase-related protein [Candidatus Gracilibacteria bacterium]